MQIALNAVNHGCFAEALIALVQSLRAQPEKSDLDVSDDNKVFSQEEQGRGLRSISR